MAPMNSRAHRGDGRRRALPALLLAALLVIACGGSGETLTEPDLPADWLAEGILTLGQGAEFPNVAVNQANAAGAQQLVVGELYSAFVKGMTLLDEIEGAAVVPGGREGRLRLDGRVTVSENQAAGDFTGRLFDYSEGGNLILGGGLRYRGTVVSDPLTGQLQTVLELEGAVRFAGQFGGTMRFGQVRLTRDPSGAFASDDSVSVTSGGVTFTSRFQLR